MRSFLYGVVFLVSLSFVSAGPIDGSIDAILEDYFKIQSALARDSATGIDAAARSIEKVATAISTDEEEVKGLVSQVQASARDIQGADLEAARSAFFELSRPLLIYLSTFHSDKEQYYRYFCPMAKKGWIQAEKDIQNPYYGSAMLKCGELIQ